MKWGNKEQPKSLLSFSWRKKRFSQDRPAGRYNRMTISACKKGEEKKIQNVLLSVESLTFKLVIHLFNTRLWYVYLTCSSPVDNVVLQIKSGLSGLVWTKVYFLITIYNIKIARNNKNNIDKKF